MRIVEPCCATKQMMMLRDALGRSGTAQFKGYGDLSLTEILPALLTRYAETDMIIVAPSLPDQAVEVIAQWMRRQRARMDGKGKLNYVRKLTVIAEMSEEKSPKASMWLKNNPFDSRLVLIDKAQTDTILLLPDIAVTGPLNMRYGREFVCTVTTVKEKVQELWKQASRLSRSYHRTVNRTKAAVNAQEQPAVDVPEAETSATDAPEETPEN